MNLVYLGAIYKPTLSQIQLSISNIFYVLNLQHFSKMP